MKNTNKIFETPGENVTYLIFSLAVLILRLGVGGVTFIAWIVSFVITARITNMFLAVKSEVTKTRLDSALWATIITWALIAFVFKWSTKWYLFGIVIYMVSELIYFMLLCFKKDISFSGVLYRAGKRNAENFFGESSEKQQ